MDRQFFTAKRHDFPDDDRGEAPRPQGLIGQVSIVFPDKAYGFLFCQGVRYFFHRNDCEPRSLFAQLEPGHYVTFDAETRGYKGPRATHVQPA